MCGVTSVCSQPIEPSQELQAGEIHKERLPPLFTEGAVDSASPRQVSEGKETHDAPKQSAAARRVLGGRRKGSGPGAKTMRNRPDWKMVEVVFEKLLLSRYYRWLAEGQLLVDPEGRQEADHIAEFCYEIGDRLRDLLREQRGEEPRGPDRKSDRQTGEIGKSSAPESAGLGSTKA